MTLSVKHCECGTRGKVVNCRPTTKPFVGSYVRRWRCPKCGVRWTTYETRVPHDHRAVIRQAARKIRNALRDVERLVER